MKEIIKLKKVTGFKTSDGKLFGAEDKIEAEQHQKDITADESLKSLVEETCYSGMGKEEILDFLKENRVKLALILSISETVLQ